MKPALLILSLFLAGLLPVHAQTITTFAGGGTGGDGGPATAASINSPASGAVDGNGNYYFWQDNTGPVIRKVNMAGIISTVAGTGFKGFSGDGGPATAANIKLGKMTVDSAGNIYFSDQSYCRIRKVDGVTGIITTIAGNGLATETGDGGPATAATLVPARICFDKQWKNLYIVSASVVRKINMATGIISYVAGDGIGGYYGDGGPATAAGISMGNICTDAANNLYLGGGNHIRKIDMGTGIISTIAGSATMTTYPGDGIPATTARFYENHMAMDARNNLYLADRYDHRVRVIDAAGMINTIAGNGTAAFSGDGGPATAAKVSNSYGVAVDICGNLYIADNGNARIRKVTIASPILTTPAISLSGPITAPALTTVTITATVTNAGSSYIIHWLNNGIEFTTTTIPSVVFTKTISTDRITARVVSTATYGCYDSTTSANHIITFPMGIASPTNASGLPVYPNPVTDVLHINTASDMYQTLTITNSVGQVMLQENITAVETAVPVSKLPAGMYYINLRGSVGVVVNKFVKE